MRITRLNYLMSMSDWKVAVRIFAFVSMVLHVLHLRYYEFPYVPFTLRIFLNWSIGAFEAHAGTWFITTKWAKRWKWLAVIMYIPPILHVPYMVFCHAPAPFGITAFALMVIIFLKIGPRRINHGENMATET